MTAQSPTSDDRFAEASAKSAFADLSPDAFRALAEERLFRDSPEPIGDFTFNPELQELILSQPMKAAAVLIPIVKRPDELTVLLTKRTETLNSHSGQVAFAGGKIDQADADAVHAALREAREEIALPPDAAEVLGVMPAYHTGSGYRISPVVALVDANIQLRANPAEVDYIFEVPLAFLMERANHRVTSRVFKGKRRVYFEMPFGEHYIWGVTAGIIRIMHDRLLEEA
jgi:8-oxo-dGTP pyrophosphatase MutT (NUDIX family)